MKIYSLEVLVFFFPFFLSKKLFSVMLYNLQLKRFSHCFSRSPMVLFNSQHMKNSVKLL